MKQQLQDFTLLIKNDRRVMAIAGFVVVAMVFWVFTADSGRKRRPPSGQHAMKPGNPGSNPNEAYADLVQAMRNEIEVGQAERAQNAEILRRMHSNVEEHKQRVTGIFETVVDKMEQLNREVDSLAEVVNSQKEVSKVNNAAGQGMDLGGGDQLAAFGFDAPSVAPPPPVPPAPTRISVISPGDQVTVKLLTGVNAPVDGTPYPVVFKLNGPITGPDGSTLDLGEARLIAAAQGSEADGRVLYRFTNLSMRNPDGSRTTVKVDGWLVGEDGKRGMQGRLIDKLGRLIAATAGVSFMTALTERISDRDVVVVGGGGPLEFDGNDFDFATASAVSDATNRLGQVLIDRYESLVPVVEVLSGRKAVAIFSQTTEIAVIDNNADFYGELMPASLN